MSGVARFESFRPPDAGIASAYRGVDDTIAALTRDNHKLRSEKANALACLEAERAENARLRGENQSLSSQLATAKALNTAGRMSP